MVKLIQVYRGDDHRLADPYEIVAGNKNVGQVKEEVAGYVNILAANQILLCNNLDKYMCHDLTPVTTYFLPNQTTLELIVHTKINIPRPIQVTITVWDNYWNHDFGSSFVVSILSNATVKRLRKMINEEIGLPPLRQNLTASVESSHRRLTIDVPISQEPLKLVEDYLPDIINHRINVKAKARTRCSVVRVADLSGRQPKTFTVDLEEDTVNTLIADYKLLFLKNHNDPNKRYTVRKRDTDGVFINGNRTLAAMGVVAGDLLDIWESVDLNLPAPRK